MLVRQLRYKLSLVLSVVIFTAGTFATTGCQGSRQARSVETSGFLEDYSQLQKGEGGQALLRYVNPGVNFATYNAILLDPIKVYPSVGDSFLRQMSEEDLQKLLDYLDATIREQLSGDYEFVDTPGPEVMRIRIALTESNPGKVALDVVSSVTPPGIAINALKTFVTDQGAGVGDATIEFEALNAISGERLVAAVDRRVGQKYTGNFDKYDRWRAAKAAFDFWAESLNRRLSELRADSK